VKEKQENLKKLKKTFKSIKIIEQNFLFVKKLKERSKCQKILKLLFQKKYGAGIWQKG
jgi:hypothetical protein